MPKYYNEGQKQSILKWRNSNKEAYNVYMNEYHKGYYQIHAEEFRKKRMSKYYFQKEWEKMCKMYDAMI